MIQALLLILKGAKFGPALWSAATIVLSIATYAQLFGWPFAAGFVGLIFVHELGHVIAARQRGLPTGLPMFIPFVGAFIHLKDTPKDAETEAYVGYGGPLLGTLASFACYFVWSNDGGPIWLALAKSGMILNLFNMIPVSPLDGGRITAVLSPRVWLIGLPVLIAVWLYNPSPMLVLIGVFALPQLALAWNYDPTTPANQAYYGVPWVTKVEYTALYLILTVILAVMINQLHGMG